MTVDDVRSLVVQAAINAHDLEAFLACFDETYDSEQPLRPEHSFRGREGVRGNWSANLARVPDLRWDLLDACFGPAKLGASGGGTARASTGRGSTSRASSSTASRTAG